MQRIWQRDKDRDDIRRTKNAKRKKHEISGWKKAIQEGFSTNQDADKGTLRYSRRRKWRQRYSLYGKDDLHDFTQYRKDDSLILLDMNLLIGNTWFEALHRCHQVFWVK